VCPVEQPVGLAPAEDKAVVERLLAGDEAAFEALVTSLHPVMVRLAAEFVPTRAVAEEVAQEAWLGVLNGLKGFEGRSSLRTWILRIVVNRARTRGARERRSVPFSALAAREAEGDEPAVDPDRFLPADHRWAGHWAVAPRPFRGPPEQVLGRETIEIVGREVARLPEAQRAVIALRDVAGFEAQEVCALLDITDGNQRVLLHRARARVRRALERHLGDG